MYRKKLKKRKKAFTYKAIPYNVLKTYFLPKGMF